MFKFSKEKRVANKIREMLYRRGFKVETKISKNTKSIYLKIDNGAIPTIRISDHEKIGNNGCKYNVIKNYTGVKSEFIKGRIRKYYQLKNIGRLIADIETERSNKIMKIGYYDYKTIRDGNSKILKYSKSKDSRVAA